jgi:hypothetical protein
MVPLASMTNILSDDKRQEVLALGRLGWTLQRLTPARRPRPRGRGQTLVRSAHSLTDPGSPAQDRSHGLAGQGLVSHSVGPTRPAAGVHAPLARGR